MPALHMLLHEHLKWEAAAALWSLGRVWVAALSVRGRQSLVSSPGSESMEVSACLLL